MSNEDLHGTGRTTRQMLSAPKDSVYVWCNGQLNYPKRIAGEYGREDLEIVSPSFLRWSHRVQGRELSGLVIDHACYLAKEEIEGLDIALSRVRPR
jgi:hypothetical protein